jgi:radical SAM protein with 4Fe4S-binding SPASM domain
LKTKELILILRKLRIKKLWNAFKILSSYYVSRITAKPVSWGLPICIAVEPTTACNLRCPECPSGLRSFTRPTGNLKIAQFKQWLDPVKDSLWSIHFYFQGEPFIHPQIHEAIRYAGQAGIYTMSSTNGHFLDAEQCEKIVRSGLDKLIISIDGTTQETYESYRIGGELKKVLEGVECLVETKKKWKSRSPYLIFQFLVVRPNEHQIPEIYKLAKQYGVDEVKLKTAQIYNYVNGSNLIPEQDIYSRYQKDKSGSYQLKNKLQNHCWKLWHSPVITWDGKVVPCCFDKDAQHVLGTLDQQNLEAIWNNEAYRKFRTDLMQSRKSIDICKNCTEGTKVWA